MNISEEGLKKYIEVFHSTLDEVATRFFSKDQVKDLFHSTLLPARITCFISTQFGVAFEYVSAEATTVTTHRGSARIEDLLVQAPSRLRSVGPLFNIGGANTSIEALTLADGFPFRLSSVKANVTFINVQFTCDALRWKRNIEYAEVYGDRQAVRWSSEAAQNRAKDEVLSALFIAQQADQKKISLHEYITSFREKAILILGAYDSEGEKRLFAIADAIKELGYEPILIKDVPDFEHYDLPQKVAAIGGLSRFVIVDDSNPSGHLTEIEICKQNRWVTILLRANGCGASWMTAGASFSSNVILEKEYDPNNPLHAVKECAQWAETKLDELKTKLDKLYPWRVGS